MKNFRQRLASYLIARRGQKPQLQFSKEIGISNATLNRLEEGTQNVTLGMIERICKGLDCDIIDLFPKK